MKQIHARKETLKKFMHWPRKIHTREMLTKETQAAENFPLPQRFSNSTIQMLFFNEHYQCNSICLKVLFSFSLSNLVMAKVMSSICVDLGGHSFIPTPHPFKIYLV